MKEAEKYFRCYCYNQMGLSPFIKKYKVVKDGRVKKNER